MMFSFDRIGGGLYPFARPAAEDAACDCQVRSGPVGRPLGCLRHSYSTETLRNKWLTLQNVLCFAACGEERCQGPLLQLWLAAMRGMPVDAAKCRARCATVLGPPGGSLPS